MGAKESADAIRANKERIWKVFMVLSSESIEVLGVEEGREVR